MAETLHSMGTASKRAALHARGMLLATAFAGACLVAAVAVVAAAPADAPVTATPEQRAIEAEVLRILATDAMRRQIAASEATWRSSPIAQTRDGRRTLRQGVMELAGTATFIAAVSEPAYPRFTWWGGAPRRWMGHTVPGARWAVDNVDNFYRIAWIDDATSYAIHMRPTGPEADQISVTLYDNYLGENNTKLDETLGAYIVSSATRREQDGSFTVTIGPEPANGRPNHLQSAPRSRQLLIRETLGDWHTKSPMAVSIERTGGPAPAPRATPDELTARAVALLAGGTDTILGFEKRFSAFPQNGFSPLNIRARAGKNDEQLAPAVGGGPRKVGPDEAWGFVAVGHFDIASDEALLVTVNPLGAAFFNFMLTTPWLVSVEHVHASGSLNNHQAIADADGNYRFVISATDPGVHNWLDTAGLQNGSMIIRWQALTRPVVAETSAGVPRIEKVKLGDVRSRLGGAAREVGPAERKRILSERALDYARRCAGEPCEVGEHLGFQPWEE